MSTEISLSFFITEYNELLLQNFAVTFPFYFLGKCLSSVKHDSSLFTPLYTYTVRITGHWIDPSRTQRVSSFQCGIKPFIPALHFCFLSLCVFILFIDHI